MHAHLILVPQASLQFYVLYIYSHYSLLEEVSSLLNSNGFFFSEMGPSYDIKTPDRTMARGHGCLWLLYSCLKCLPQIYTLITVRTCTYWYDLVPLIISTKSGTPGLLYMDLFILVSHILADRWFKILFQLSSPDPPIS